MATSKDIGAKLGGSQKQMGAILKSTSTSKDTNPIFGNGAKLTNWKLGGSQKQIGSMLRSMATSKDIGPMLGGVQKLMHWKLGGSQKQSGSTLRSIATSKETTLGKQQPTSEITLGK